MKVLIASASKHGSTTEIADALGAGLRERGFDVDVEDLADAPSLSGYDAVVIGSAVYAGRWLKDARDFVAGHTSELAEDRVWLFSSGPLDDPATETLAPATLAGLSSSTGALGHHVFAGRLDRAALSRGERLLAKMVHAPAGDFRDWDDVAQWSKEIAEVLSPT